MCCFWTHSALCFKLLCVPCALSQRSIFSPPVHVQASVQEAPSCCLCDPKSPDRARGGSNEETSSLLLVRKAFRAAGAQRWCGCLCGSAAPLTPGGAPHSWRLVPAERWGRGALGAWAFLLDPPLNVGASANLSPVLSGCGLTGEAGGSPEGKSSCNKPAGERSRTPAVYLRPSGPTSLRRPVLGGPGVVGGQ